MTNDLFLGIEIGGTKLQLALGNASADILERRRFHINQAEGGAGIRLQIESALPEMLTGRKLAGVGIGFGGPVDNRTGRICCSHQIEGWSEFPIGDWAGQLAGAPVSVDNDANTAALAEATLGAGKEANPVFYVTLGSGVGGGLVLDKKIYHGALPGEVEIGHVRLDKSGTIMEERCSGWAVDRKIRKALQGGEPSVLREMAGPAPGGEARHLSAALQQNDPLAQRILSEVCDDLAFGLSHVGHLMHPEMIVLGGGLSLLGEPLRAGVADLLPKYLMRAFHPGPKITLSALGEDVVPIGALLLATSASSKSQSIL